MAVREPISNIPARHVPLAERRARLGVRHLLAADKRPTDALSIVQALGSLHATDPATVYLTVALRLHEPTIKALDRALITDRSVIRHHAMRRTLWIMEPHVAKAAHAACTISLAQREWTVFGRMLSDSGIVDTETWIRAGKHDALAAVEALGTATARKVAAHAPHLNVPMHLSAGKSYAGIQGAHTRLVQNLGFDGALVRTRSTGSWVSGEYEWATVGSWLPGGIVNPSITPRSGAALLAAVYLRAFGPATTADLQWWAGWTAGMTRQALTDVDAVAVTTDTDTCGTVAQAWLLPDDLEPVETAARWATLLPSLDPTVMGWKQREWYAGAHGAFGHTLFDRNGNAGNAIMADGRVVGTWAQRPANTGAARVAVRMFEPLSKQHARQVEDSIDRYMATVGTTVVRPRYPAPLQASLIAGPD